MTPPDQQKTLNQYDLEARQKRRASERDIGPIPAIKNLRRRRKAKGNTEYYLRTYFDYIYFNPFSNDQKYILKVLKSGVDSLGWQALAAERGGGKSQITRGFITHEVNYGRMNFVVLINANKAEAANSLENIQYMYESSELLAEDFPEICYPVMKLEGAAQRARMQICEGERTNLEWGRDIITMPEIKNSLAAKAIIMTRGIDGAIRGLNKRAIRPDNVILDDIETRESAYSVSQSRARKATVNQDVIGLAGPGKKISAVMLGTIIKKDCIIDEYTDPKRQPAWHGVRQKLLIKKPDNLEMWDRFIELRRAGQIEGDKLGKDAHLYYKKTRKKMDKGAEVSNKYRYNKEFELSALEATYVLIADMGWTDFACEYQNEPEDNTQGSVNLEIATVCKKVNHLERGVVPAWCEKLTCYIDVGGRLLHWSIVAWRQGLEGYIVDYGTEPVHSPHTGKLNSDENKESVENAIHSALVDFYTWERDNGWANADTGEVRHVDLGLVDSNWLPDPVCLFCQETRGVFRPAQGFGTGSGKAKYKQPASKGTAKTKKIGHHWYASQLPRYGWLFNLDADYFKNAVHTGFMIPEKMQGSISLYGSDPVKHRDFARQIVAEQWVREFQPGKGWSEGFVVTYRHNHYLDTVAGNYAVANMLGIKALTKTETKPTPKPTKPIKRPAKRTAGKKIKSRY